MNFETSLLRDTIQTSREGILVIDQITRGVYEYNQKFLDLFCLTSEILNSTTNASRLLESIQHTLVNPDEYLRLVEHLYQNPAEESSDIVRLRNGTIINRYSRSIPLSNGGPGRAWFFRDITQQEKNRLKEQSRAQTMTLIAIGAPLEEILTAIACGVEEVDPQFVCTILVLDRNVKFLAIGAAPSLPRAMIDAMKGGVIDPTLGSCGEAIATKKRVIVPDISNHPHFSRLQSIIRLIEAKASWSEPILDGNGVAIGSIGIFVKKVGSPTEDEGEAMRDAAHIAAIAIQRRRTEDEIVSQELRFRTVFEGSNDALIIGTKDGIIDCNNRAWQLFEMPDKALMLKCHLLDYSPEFQPDGRRSSELAAEYLRSVIDRGTIQFEWLHCTYSGREFPTDIVIRTYYYEGRRVLQFTIRDISDRKAAERAIDIQREKLVASSKMSSLGEMAGGVAHEINNPLTIIIGQANRLRRKLERGTVTPTDISVELTKIESTAHRIAKIIKGLRSFSRDSENDPMELTSVNQILDDTLELCQEKIKHNSIKLSIGQVSQAKIRCRPGQISQVVLNLLSNATDAVETLNERWIKIETDTDESRGEILISVTDSGNGIDKTIWDKLMQPFFTTKDVGKGTGLGLSISRGITEAHGGSLQYDRGSEHTRFLLRLPLAH
ncbi:MAG: PAS domain-containing protein [Proteobacteria bacterium]|nr:MAG: PAS domain-containing protein [Pseudomonadota bacterium]